MLLAGDEFGQTQQGNNNAYCQDNETAWLNWTGIDDAGKSMQLFIKALIKIRSAHIVFHRHRFFHGNVIPGTNTKDIVWLKPDGEEMRNEDWGMETTKSMAMLISGKAGQYHLTERGVSEPDDSFVLILNASDEIVEHALPKFGEVTFPVILIDTCLDMINQEHAKRATNPLLVNPHALILVRYAHETE